MGPQKRRSDERDGGDCGISIQIAVDALWARTNGIAGDDPTHKADSDCDCHRYCGWQHSDCWWPGRHRQGSLCSSSILESRFNAAGSCANASRLVTLKRNTEQRSNRSRGASGRGTVRMNRAGHLTPVLRVHPGIDSPASEWQYPWHCDDCEPAVDPMSDLVIVAGLQYTDEKAAS